MPKMIAIREFQSTTSGSIAEGQIFECSDANAVHFEEHGLASIMKQRRPRAESKPPEAPAAEPKKPTPRRRTRATAKRLTGDSNANGTD